MALSQSFLSDLTSRQVPVTVFLLNGVKLQGQVIESDENTFLLKRENMTQLVFKHAVSTIMPVTPL